MRPKFDSCLPDGLNKYNCYHAQPTGPLGGRREPPWVEHPGCFVRRPMLKSRTIQDKIIDRFGLMERYKPWLNRWLFTFYREDCREKMIDDVMTAADDTTTGIVTLCIRRKTLRLQRPWQMRSWRR